MYRFIVAFLLLACCFANVAYSQDDSDQSMLYYRSSSTYDGIYASQRLYQYNSYRETWFASSQFKLWTELNCRAAREAIELHGEWTGNLTDRGACAGENEAPTWAAGNYLNFLRAKALKR